MGSFAQTLVKVTCDEFLAYDGQNETDEKLKKRIKEYWDFLKRPDLMGEAWSAAFISYMMSLAGAGSSFAYNPRHSVYMHKAINDLLAKRDTSFWGHRPGSLTIAPGDVLGMNRVTGSVIEYDWAAKNPGYASHCDIVVSVDGTGVHTIGGNVGKTPGRIDKKTFVWKKSRLVNEAAPAQVVFVVIRSRLP